MNKSHVLTDLLKATAINEDETILAKIINEILHAYWNEFHDCRNREWDLFPLWLASVVRDKEDIKPFHSYIASYMLI